MTITAYLSIRQTAEMLGASADTITALIRSGELPASDIAVSRGKARWRIAIADIQAMLDRRRNVPPPPRPRRRKHADGYTPRYYR